MKKSLVIALSLLLVTCFAALSASFLIMKGNRLEAGNAAPEVAQTPASPETEPAGAEVEPKIFRFVSTVDLSNKTYYAYGDSITWGYYAGKQMDKPYPTQVAELLGLQSYLNLGQSGATLCANDMGLVNMTERILSRPYYADIVSVLMGVNDYNRSLPLGTDGDKDNHTIYGSLYLVMEHFKTYYSDSFVFFMTPLNCYLGGHDGTKNNLQGYNLTDVSTAIKVMAEQYGYPVLDLFGEGDFESEMYSAESDGIHPSQRFFETHTALQIAQFINDHFDPIR